MNATGDTQTCIPGGFHDWLHANQHQTAIHAGDGERQWRKRDSLLLPHPCYYVVVLLPQAHALHGTQQMLYHAPPVNPGIAHTTQADVEEQVGFMAGRAWTEVLCRMRGRCAHDE